MKERGEGGDGREGDLQQLYANASAKLCGDNYKIVHELKGVRERERERERERKREREERESLRPTSTLLDQQLFRYPLAIEKKWILYYSYNS